MSDGTHDIESSATGTLETASLDSMESCRDEKSLGLWCDFVGVVVRHTQRSGGAEKIRERMRQIAVEIATRSPA